MLPSIGKNKFSEEQQKNHSIDAITLFIKKSSDRQGQLIDSLVAIRESLQDIKLSGNEQRAEMQAAINRLLKIQMNILKAERQTNVELQHMGNKKRSSSAKIKSQQNQEVISPTKEQTSKLIEILKLNDDRPNEPNEQMMAQMSRIMGGRPVAQFNEQSQIRKIISQEDQAVNNMMASIAAQQQGQGSVQGSGMPMMPPGMQGMQGIPPGMSGVPTGIHPGQIPMSQMSQLLSSVDPHRQMPQASQQPMPNLQPPIPLPSPQMMSSMPMLSIPNPPIPEQQPIPLQSLVTSVLAMNTVNVGPPEPSPGPKIPLHLKPDKRSYEIAEWISKDYLEVVQKSLSQSQQSTQASIAKGILSSFCQVLLKHSQNSAQWKSLHTFFIERYHISAKDTLQYLSNYTCPYSQSQIPSRRRVEPQKFFKDRVDLIEFSEQKFQISANHDYSIQIKRFLCKLDTKLKEQSKQLQETLDSLPQQHLESSIFTNLVENANEQYGSNLNQRGVFINYRSILTFYFEWIFQLENCIRYFQEYLDDCVKLTVPSIRVILLDSMDEMISSLIRNKQQRYHKLNAIYRNLPDYLMKANLQMPYIPEKQRSLLSVTYVLSEAIESIAMEHLNCLIDTILTVESKAAQLDGRVKDLKLLKCLVRKTLSCRIEYRSKEVLKSSEFKKLVRNINVDWRKVERQPNSQLYNRSQIDWELTLVNKSDKKFRKVEAFWFLDEMQHFPYGPLIFSACVNTGSEHLTRFFESELESKEMRAPIPITLVKTSCRPDGLIVIEGQQPCNNTFSFICFNCKVFKKAYETFLPVFVSVKAIVCGMCALASISDRERTRFCLGDTLAPFYTYISYREAMMHRPSHIVAFKPGFQKRLLHLTNEGTPFRSQYRQVDGQETLSIQNMQKYLMFAIKKQLFRMPIRDSSSVQQLSRPETTIAAINSTYQDTRRRKVIRLGKSDKITCFWDEDSESILAIS